MNLGEHVMTEHVVDAKGLNCPLPVLRVKKALKEIEIGEILDIYATDPGSVKDFEAFCRTTGNEMVASKAENGEFYFQIKRLK